MFRERFVSHYSNAISMQANCGVTLQNQIPTLLRFLRELQICFRQHSLLMSQFNISDYSHYLYQMATFLLSVTKVMHPFNLDAYLF